MLPEDKSGLLAVFLGSLPGNAAARLAMAVEVDRLMDGRTLPHAQILEGLRPVLRRDHNERTPTPLRLFCRPFQDLLTCQPRKAKQKGTIARGTLVPAWNWISQSLLPAEAAAYMADIKTLVVTHNIEDAIARASQFWPLAGEAMRATLATETGCAQAQKVLGDAAAVADAQEMALLLLVGSDMEKLQELLPIPVPSFNEGLVWQVREIYDHLIKTEPDAASYLPVVAMNRLARPWEALRLPLLVTRHTDEVLIAKTDMGLVGEILFARMDELKTAIQTTRHPLFDDQVLINQARTFADLSSHIVKEIELKREGEWGKRLLAERVEIGKVMEGFMDRAPKEFGMALPMSKGTGAEFGKPIAAEKHQMALRYARLVAGCRNFAAAASFAAKQKGAYEELCTALKRYNEDLIRALKADPQNPVVVGQFQFCTDATTILFSDEEAELLRRRGRAAQTAAA